MSINDYRKIAAAKIIGCPVWEVERLSVSRYKYKDEEFAVLSEGRVKEDMESAIENYLMEEVWKCIPEKFHDFFNVEEFKLRASDAGRGYWLSIDGEEGCAEVEGKSYFLYRVK